MKISTKGRYAVRLMIDIAVHSGNGNVSLKDVAKRENISLKYLEQIVNILSKAGFLKAQRGAQGGYRMTGSPDKYTVGDVLRATEGSLAPVSCLDDEVNDCPNIQSCTTIKLWDGLYHAVNDYLDGITIADLANDMTAAEADLGCFI